MRTFTLGLILALTLAMASPAIGAPNFETPDFDLVEWVLQLFEFDRSTESTVSSRGSSELSEDATSVCPSADSDGASSVADDEMGPYIDPDG